MASRRCYWQLQRLGRTGTADCRAALSREIAGDKDYKVRMQKIGIVV